jgi:hypothetical protein
MKSILSMKKKAESFFSAFSEAFQRSNSNSSVILDMIPGPLMRKEKVSVLFAFCMSNENFLTSFVPKITKRTEY